jgi:hypothetical protein
MGKEDSQKPSVNPDGQAGPGGASILPKVDSDLITYVGKGIPAETLRRARKNQKASHKEKN